MKKVLDFFRINKKQIILAENNLNDIENKELLAKINHLNVSKTYKIDSNNRLEMSKHFTHSDNINNIENTFISSTDFKGQTLPQYLSNNTLIGNNQSLDDYKIKEPSIEKKIKLNQEIFEKNNPKAIQKIEETLDRKVDSIMSCKDSFKNKINFNRLLYNKGAENDINHICNNLDFINRATKSRINNEKIKDLENFDQIYAKSIDFYINEGSIETISYLSEIMQKFL